MVLTKYIDPDNGYAIKVKTVEQAKVVIDAINKFTDKEDDSLEGVKYILKRSNSLYIRPTHSPFQDVAWIAWGEHLPAKKVEFKTVIKALSKEQL